MMGRYTKEGQEIKKLKETIALRDKEIKDIKYSLADVLSRIKAINESNTYSNPSIKTRKISELCTDTRYELLIDEIDSLYKNEKQKIIELPNTNKVNK